MRYYFFWILTWIAFLVLIILVPIRVHAATPPTILNGSMFIGTATCHMKHDKLVPLKKWKKSDDSMRCVFSVKGNITYATILNDDLSIYEVWKLAKPTDPPKLVWKDKKDKHRTLGHFI